MSYHSESPESREFGTLGVVLILYSIIFIGVLAYGWYYLLFGSLSPVLSLCLALVMALLAWALAKIIGGTERGIAGAKALFIALLVISAVGVFNTLMIRLEGKAIFTEVIDNASKRFNDLPPRVREGLKNIEVERLRTGVEALKIQLAQEISNPRNCGDGPEANRILGEIRVVLPTFTRYSGTSRDCGNNEALIKMYWDQMDKLMYASDTFVRGNVVQLESLQRAIDSEVPQQLAKLDQMRKETNAGANLLQHIRSELEESASSYQQLALGVQSSIPAARDDSVFASKLDIEPARNLGEWGHLLPLFLSRVDRVQTWVYLAVAVFLDWLLVHIFFRLASHRRAMPVKGRKLNQAPAPGTPW